MFEKLVNALKARAKPAYDPSVLNDRVAMLTEWSPLVRGGANFKTHKLVQVYQSRYEFRAGLGMKAFSAVFSLMGLFFALMAGGAGIFQKDFPIAVALFMSLFGLVFVFIGIAIYWTSSSPRVFDKEAGFYWKGRTEPNLMINPEYQNCTKLTEIHAVQLISEYVSGNKSSYTSYELNLVLKDGRRINVTDHGNYESVKRDAETIAGFLNIPVWNAAG